MEWGLPRGSVCRNGRMAMANRLGWIAVASTCAFLCWTTLAQSQVRANRREGSTWGIRASAMLERLSSEDAAAPRSDEARDTLLASAEAAMGGRAGSLVDSALALRLALQLGPLTAAERREAVSAVRACPEAGAEFVFGMHERDDAGSAWRLFVRLVRERGGEVERQGALGGAVALVHERGFEFRCNENTASSPDPLAIFDYYAGAGRTLVFRPSELPLELLTRVVDTTADVEDMRWATSRHPQARDVGQRFHDVTYDRNHLATGQDKRVTVEGFTLRNIQKHGGVCADQAYYACGVGKALGVPTSYVTAQGAEASHAWVGYFRMRGREGEWDFKEGRYDAYQNVRGWTMDPQTGVQLSDGALAITATLFGTTAEQRRSATAWADASRALGVAGGDSATRLAWLEHGVNACAGARAIWDELAACGTQQSLTSAQAARWIETVRRTFGPSQPDFLFDIAASLLAGVEDARERASAWERVTRDFARRPDLLSAALMGVGMALEKQGQPDRAMVVYQDIITKYTKDGLAIGHALLRSDAILTERGRDDEAVRMYELAWRRLPRPDFAVFFWPGSAWFKVGGLYASRLEQAGRSHEARRVLAEIGVAPR